MRTWSAACRRLPPAPSTSQPNPSSLKTPRRAPRISPVSALQSPQSPKAPHAAGPPPTHASHQTQPRKHRRQRRQWAEKSRHQPRSTMLPCRRHAREDEAQRVPAGAAPEACIADFPRLPQIPDSLYNCPRSAPPFDLVVPLSLPQLRYIGAYLYCNQVRQSLVCSAKDCYNGYPRPISSCLAQVRQLRHHLADKQQHNHCHHQRDVFATQVNQQQIRQNLCI